MTKQREIVLETVRNSDRHLTAEEVFERARVSMPRIVRATVYNNLNYLTEHGMIRRVRVYREPDRFDRVMEKHDHMICDRCGRMTDIKLGDVDSVLAEKTGVDITSYELCVHYICDECREKEKQKGAR